MAERTCSVEGCVGRVVGRGWCGRHWQRWRRYGTTDLPTQEDRFWTHVDKTGLCWEWTAFIDRNGYGKTKLLGETFAHRAVWVLLRGPVPAGYDIDHLHEGLPTPAPRTQEGGAGSG